MTAFRASYADFRLVKTRGVVQVVLEVPLHDADAAYQVLGGLPDPAREVWVGVARLKPESEVMPDSAAKLPAPAPGGPKPVRAFTSLPLPQQAGMLCRDPVFWAFLNERYKCTVATAEVAKKALCDYCGIATRRALLDSPYGAKEFISLREKFMAWKLAA